MHCPGPEDIKPNSKAYSMYVRILHSRWQHNANCSVNLPDGTEHAQQQKHLRTADTMAPLDLDKYAEIAKQCKYLPENDLKVRINAFAMTIISRNKPDEQHAQKPTYQT